VPLKQSADTAMAETPSIERCLVVRRTGQDVPMQDGRDLWWDDVVSGQPAECPPEPMDSEDLLYLLYTSGTTAKPKGIMHTTGGYLTQIAWTHLNIFDIKQDTDVYWCAADVGWVTGHSYIVYAPLANRTTSVMYEGTPDFPDKDRLWSIVERYGVTILYTAPTAIRSFMKWGTEYPEKHDLSSLRLLGTVANRSTPRRGSGTGNTSAAEGAPSSTRGGRPRPARSSSARCPAPPRSSPAARRFRFPASALTSSTTAANRCRSPVVVISS